MKNIFVILFLFTSMLAFTQTVTVQCDNPAVDCFKADPSEGSQEFLYTYKAVTANDPQNDVKSYSWTSSATFAPTSTVDQSKLTGKWANLPNSYSHWIQIIVTYHLYKKGTTIDTIGVVKRYYFRGRNTYNNINLRI